MMKKLLQIIVLTLTLTTSYMADPNWSAQYNFGQTPEQNGFTRVLYGEPTVSLVTSGNTANRRIDINSDTGDVIFLLSTVPNLNNKTQGATVEVVAAVTGAGNAGFELTFQTNHFGIQIYSDKITVTINDRQEPHEFAIGQSNETNTTVRATVTPDGADGTLRIYRNAVLVDTRALVPSDQPLPRVLFWAEAGGSQTIRAMKFYIGGPVAP
jgi:hypothetical protein